MKKLVGKAASLQTHPFSKQFVLHRIQLGRLTGVDAQDLNMLVFSVVCNSQVLRVRAVKLQLCANAGDGVREVTLQ